MKTTRDFLLGMAASLAVAWSVAFGAIAGGVLAVRWLHVKPWPVVVIEVPAGLVLDRIGGAR